MACGTPTVVTTEGGLWEMVTWGLEALYANPLDPEAFGHAIATTLLYPRVADQLARFGSQRARSSFTWNGIAQQLVSLPQLAHEPAVRSEQVRETGPRSRISVASDDLERDVEWLPAPSS
jgi:hypothetical protein